MIRTKTLAWFAVSVLAVGLPMNALALDTAERSLSLELPVADVDSLRIENLLGSVEVKRAKDASVARIEARVVAEAKGEAEAKGLADAIELEQREVDGKTLVHVVYPLDTVEAFRPPKAGVKGLVSRWSSSLFGKDATEVEYAGRTVLVEKDRKAAGLAVHLAVYVPFEVETSVSQSVGAIHAKYMRGNLHFEAVEGSVEIVSCFGAFRVESSSADVIVASVQGESLEVETGTGNVDLEVVKIDRVRVRSGSGTIRGVGVKANELQVENANGNVEFADTIPQNAEVRTKSGDVDLALRLKSAKNAVIHSDSGDVVLRLAGQIGFDLEAETKSGSVKTLGMDLDVVGQEGRTSRLKRGPGGPDFNISANGGTVTVRPYDASRIQILMGKAGN